MGRLLGHTGEGSGCIVRVVMLCLDGLQYSFSVKMRDRDSVVSRIEVLLPRPSSIIRDHVLSRICQQTDASQRCSFRSQRMRTLGFGIPPALQEEQSFQSFLKYSRKYLSHPPVRTMDQRC